MKNLVSVCLFDEMDRYQPYLPPTLRAHHNLFRGWGYRIYHDHKIDQGPYSKALRALEARGMVELVFVTKDVLIEQAMLWRLLPLWDNDVERFVIRDVDMIAPYRERRAVEVWIRSGLAVHSMSDLRGHHDYPSINGMMGFHVAKTRPLLDVGPGRHAPTFEAFLSRAGWSREIWSSNFRASGRGADSRYRVHKSTTNNMHFLGTYVWPRVEAHAVEHRMGGSRTFEGTARSYTTVEEIPPALLGVRATVPAGDALIPFIGASMANSNIKLGAITDFYKKNGDPAIEQIFAECEALL